MTPLSFRKLLFLTHLGLTALALAAATLIGGKVADRMLTAETQRELERALPVFTARLTAAADRFDPAIVDAVCKAIFRERGFRLTVIDSGGRVLGDGNASPDRMSNHAARPEFIGAMKSGRGHDQRVSETVQRAMLYTARRLETEGLPDLVVRLAADVEQMRAPLRRMWLVWRWVSLLLLLTAAGLSLLAAGLIARPLAIIRRRVNAFEGGDFEQLVPGSRLSDLDRLATGLNRMAHRLDDRIRTVEQQRDDEEALLGCMVEGVLAVDRDKRVLRINRAATALLGAGNAPALVGQSLFTVSRNPACLALIERVLGGESPVEGVIELNAGERVLQAHGVALTGAGGRRLGALLVLNDVTALSRIETMQRDFVANVSHELKTPITSIKGFAETLLDNGHHDSATQRRFLEIILKQADRVQSIVSDILSLAAIEHGVRTPGQPLERVSVSALIAEALLPCQTAAAEREVTLQVECPEGAHAELYPFFMEQALINLVDNAITFSPAGGTVTVSVAVSEADLTISVRDEGPGIAREHHARLWERFYRVDKGRSRRSGGTGLGLSIVRRIAILHGGRVELDSAPGAGSTFRMRIPRQGRRA